MVQETRHHHEVPRGVFDEIPSEGYRLPGCWVKKYEVRHADYHLALVFFLSESETE